ncbi:MAG: DUF438 domain-containing protein [Ignavibacteria bacterium]|nr:DUF438 domain-containing protein [Ignavibacteria bacterium]
MSELINNSRERIEQLKHLFLKLNQGVDVETVKGELKAMLGKVPYGEIVQAEQELIQEGMSVAEIQKYCDLHSQAVRGNIDIPFEKIIPDGHPIDTMQKENAAIVAEVTKLKEIFVGVKYSKGIDVKEEVMNILTVLNNLSDIEKHYSKKENLIFPYLEKYGITGPSKVMWGKDDEVREYIKKSKEALKKEKLSIDDLKNIIDTILDTTINAIYEMVEKEEKILLPMCIDRFTDLEWYEIYKQMDDIGYCLYAPRSEWQPEVEIKEEEQPITQDRIKLSTGSFTKEELEGVLNALPVDLTFVDKDDRVKFFSHGAKRIFERNKAILGREVQNCHPPSSVHIVNKILDDFKSGRQNSAKFWINFQDMYVHIAYYAVRNEKGEYMGTLEVTQDIREFKRIEGERRLLTYDE